MSLITTSSCSPQSSAKLTFEKEQNRQRERGKGVRETQRHVLPCTTSRCSAVSLWSLNRLIEPIMPESGVRISWKRKFEEPVLSLCLSLSLYFSVSISLYSISLSLCFSVSLSLYSISLCFSVSLLLRVTSRREIATSPASHLRAVSFSPPSPSRAITYVNGPRKRERGKRLRTRAWFSWSFRSYCTLKRCAH